MKEDDKFSCLFFDYMSAYFDFFIDQTGEYKIARTIVDKYKEFTIFRFKKMFAKIQE